MERAAAPARLTPNPTSCDFPTVSQAPTRENRAQVARSPVNPWSVQTSSRAPAASADAASTARSKRRWLIRVHRRVSEQPAEQHDRREHHRAHGIHRVHQAEGDRERHLGQVDDEEEPGVGADEPPLVDAGRRQVERHHRARRVGGHRREPDAAARPPRRGAALVHGGCRVGVVAPLHPQLEQHQHEQHPADRAAQRRVVDGPQEERPDHEPGNDGREQALDERPVGVVAVVPAGDDVADDEDGEDRGGRLLGRQHGGEDGDRDDGEATQRRLGVADDPGGERHQGEAGRTGGELHAAPSSSQGLMSGH